LLDPALVGGQHQRRHKDGTEDQPEPAPAEGAEAYNVTAILGGSRRRHGNTSMMAMTIAIATKIMIICARNAP